MATMPSFVYQGVTLCLSSYDNMTSIDFENNELFLKLTNFTGSLKLSCVKESATTESNTTTVEKPKTKDGGKKLGLLQPRENSTEESPFRQPPAPKAPALVSPLGRSSEASPSQDTQNSSVISANTNTVIGRKRGNSSGRRSSKDAKDERTTSSTSVDTTETTTNETKERGEKKSKRSKTDKADVQESTSEGVLAAPQEKSTQKKQKKNGQKKNAEVEKPDTEVNEPNASDSCITSTTITSDNEDSEETQALPAHWCPSPMSVERDTVGSGSFSPLFSTSPNATSLVSHTNDICTGVERGIEPNAPLGRWGHTLTSMGNGKLFVYGGQCDDDEKTVGDLHVCEVGAGGKIEWSRPINCDSIARVWHSTAFLPSMNLLVTLNGEKSVGEVTEQMHDCYVMDTEIYLFYPPGQQSGEPTPRSGSSAALFGKDLVVFGGTSGRKWHNTLFVLECANWNWRTPPCDGSPPTPRTYHTATTIEAAEDGTQRMVIYGGNSHGDTFGDVIVLEAPPNSKRWRWSRPVIVGTPPSPRCGHTATLLTDNRRVLVCGGWNPDYPEAVFGDAFVLDTKLWEWRPAGEAAINAAGARVGAAAAPVEGGDEHFVAFFGGQDSEGKRWNDVKLLPVAAIE